MPTYTGLKDFVRGCQKLLKIHGNVPVFIQTEYGKVAPFGIAVTSTDLLGGDALILVGGNSKTAKEFEPGDCTD